MKKTAMALALLFEPTSVDELLSDSQVMYGWLNEHEEESDVLQSIQRPQKSLEQPSYKQPVYDDLDHPISGKNDILALVKTFIKREGIKPRPSDLIEAGCSKSSVYNVLSALEKEGVIKRTKLGPKHTVIELV